jgi:hypothetical protein
MNSTDWATQKKHKKNNLGVKVGQILREGKNDVEKKEKCWRFCGERWDDSDQATRHMMGTTSQFEENS